MWKVLPATLKHPWKPEWLTLVKTLRGWVPPARTVLVLADCGLYAKWLFEAIQHLGWHPLLRVNAGGTFRPAGWVRRYPLTHWTPAVGSRRQGRGTVFAGKKPPGLHPSGLPG